MKPVVVSDVLAVGEFPSPEHLVILAKAGFKGILNNQPDGEVARFQSSAAIETEARRLGLAYAYAPLSSRTPPEDELARYDSAIAALPSPIYAFCYSGSRSAAACALLLTERAEVDAIIKDFADAGYDLAGLKPWLEDERFRRTGKLSSVARSNGAPPTGNGASGHASAADAAAAETVPVLRSAVIGNLQPPIVVMPRAAGYGGFAR